MFFEIKIWEGGDSMREKGIKKNFNADDFQKELLDNNLLLNLLNMDTDNGYNMFLEKSFG